MIGNCSGIEYQVSSISALVPRNENNNRIAVGDWLDDTDYAISHILWSVVEKVYVVLAARNNGSGLFLYMTVNPDAIEREEHYNPWRTK